MDPSGGPQGGPGGPGAPLRVPFGPPIEQDPQVFKEAVGGACEVVIMDPDASFEV